MTHPDIEDTTMHSISVASRKRKPEGLLQEFPQAAILDITSASTDPLLRCLSPFWPHGGIPVPFTGGAVRARSVEAIWQGLKVFPHEGADLSLFEHASMQGIKRSCRGRGLPIGHQKGLEKGELLGYLDARRLIYLPSYLWVLENAPKASKALCYIRTVLQHRDVVLLDYNTNPEFRDLGSPLSHAALVKLYLEGRYPDFRTPRSPLTEEEHLLLLRQRKAERARRRAASLSAEEQTGNLF